MLIIGGLPNGPCGEEFKASFSCFHYSDKEPKGSECIEHFVAMQVSMQIWVSVGYYNDGFIGML